MGHHPAKYELLAYAESLVDQETAISARIAGHLAHCPGCMREVEAMRASLAFVAAGREIEPSEELTASILLSSQVARRATQARNRRWNVAVGLVKTLACAAGIAIVASVYFGAALDAGGLDVNPVHTFAAAKRMADSPPSAAETIHNVAAEIQTLAAAVNAPSTTPPTLWEREHRRAVEMLGGDIAAALAALERNPGCTRATNLIDANLQRQVETLRTLYIERSL